MSEPRERLPAEADAADQGALREAPLSEAQQAEAKRYGRASLACDLTERAIDVLYLVVVAVVAARPLDAWLARFSPLANDWLRLPALFAIITAVNVAVCFPLSVYAGYVLEHKFGLSRQSFPRWLWRHAKKHALAALLGVVLVEGLYAVIRTAQDYWWIVAGGLFFLVSVILGQLAPVLILPLFYKIKRLADEELTRRLAALAEGTGLSIEGVYRMEMSAETVKANAMLTGLGRTRRVILGDTLLDRFSQDEIAAVFAHEIGHHVHRHIPKMLAAGAIYSLAGFFICDLLVMRYVASIEPTAGYAAFPVFALPLLLLTLQLFFMLVEPLQNAISRRFERQCDRYAVTSTKLAEAYRAALGKLARINKADLSPHPLEVFLFHSHPPIAERIAAAKE